MFTVTALAACLVASAAGCVFDCESNVCGGAPVVYVNRSFSFPASSASQYGMFASWEWTALGLHSLDLSGRGITSIAPGGLRCYFELDSVGDDDSQYRPNSTQAVLLDNNLLTAMPSLSQLNYTGAISLRDNQITLIPPMYFGTSPDRLMPSLGMLNLLVDLDGNRVALVNESLGGFTGDLLVISLRRNNITSVPEGLVGQGSDAYSLSVNLGDNRIAALPPAVLAGFGVTLIDLKLANNSLTVLPDFSVSVGGAVMLDVSHNRFTTLPPAALQCDDNTLLLVNLSHNRIESLPPSLIGGPSAFKLIVDLSFNSLHTIPDDLVANFTGQTLVAILSHNHLTTVSSGSTALLDGVSVVSVTVDLSFNDLVVVGPIFTGLQATLSCTVDFTSNFLTGDSVARILFSYQSSQAALTAIFQYNAVTVVPAYLFGGIGLNVVDVDANPLAIFFPRLDLSHNPITYISPSVFATPNTTVRLQNLGIDFSHTTAPLPTPTEPFNLDDSFLWGLSGATLVVNFSNTSVQPAVVAFLSSLGTAALQVGLSRNGYTSLAALAFQGSMAVSIDLSHNLITELSRDAFSYNFDLKTLILSHNLLTAITATQMASTPALLNLHVDHNRVLAMPELGNYHVSSASDAADNPLTCRVYGPLALDCVCTAGYTVQVFCGYVRCVPVEASDGCSSAAIANISDCSLAPWTACVEPASVPVDQFYNAATRSFESVAQCANAFGQADRSLAAYEFRRPSASSNRLCSICSTCPSGFDVSPCTPTTNTKCTKQFALSNDVLAGIIIAVLVPVVLLVFSLAYIRYRTKLIVTRTQLGDTKNFLELTERLLGDEREENALMAQGWRIAEDDLVYETVIGEGAFGRVYRGTWGHIQVAIKVLRHRMDELDQQMVDDFNREVSVMRSIRHPHLLILFGAGVDKMSRAFLVTELMAGSLKLLLLDRTTSLDWETRLRFASDIAQGMKYLADKETVHRDLKADNCFVDNDRRVKVADFGTGRISHRIGARPGATPQATVDHPAAAAVGAVMSDDGQRQWGKTLSSGVGSLLWMAPEALRGSPIKECHALSLDVYSYAIVLWEIWTRARPWDEVKEDGVHFAVKLAELVGAGVRPRRPSDCAPAPEGFQLLMESCWVGEPGERPTFGDILARLGDVGANLATRTSSL